MPLAESAASMPLVRVRAELPDTSTGPAAALRETGPPEEDATTLPGPLSVTPLAPPAAMSTGPPLVTPTDTSPYTDATPSLVAASKPLEWAVSLSSA